MIKVITYGTYDLLHHGHRRLLERARALGDYLIVGVTADGFDRARGKLNVQQSLLERIAAVRATGLADEIIVEEYEGQKIDDIRRYGVQIFTVGSDWVGKFDYLREYCEVIYLPRTEGISSSALRTERRMVRLGLVGEGRVLSKYKRECAFVNGLQAAGICTAGGQADLSGEEDILVTDRYEELLEQVDAVYIVSHPSRHFQQVEAALRQGRHVLCESPVVLREEEYRALSRLAEERGLVLMDAIKTAYATAYYRLLLLLKSGCIGEIVSVDVTCTSLKVAPDRRPHAEVWNSICAWGPVAMLPVFQLLGTDYLDCSMTSCLIDEAAQFDIFTKIDFLYPHATASVKVGKGIKSEGELIISGTKGYIYVPAPWWKTDYFEIRYENPAENRRCFYQLEGEGIRYELVSFVRSIELGTSDSYIDQAATAGIIRVMEDFYSGEKLRRICLKSVPCRQEA